MQENLTLKEKKDGQKLIQEIADSTTQDIEVGIIEMEWLN